MTHSPHSPQRPLQPQPQLRPLPDRLPRPTTDGVPTPSLPANSFLTYEMILCFLSKCVFVHHNSTYHVLSSSSFFSPDLRTRALAPSPQVATAATRWINSSSRPPRSLLSRARMISWRSSAQLLMYARAYAPTSLQLCCATSQYLFFPSVLTSTSTSGF